MLTIVHSRIVYVALPSLLSCLQGLTGFFPFLSTTVHSIKHRNLDVH